MEKDRWKRVSAEMIECKKECFNNHRRQRARDSQGRETTPSSQHQTAAGQVVFYGQRNFMLSYTWSVTFKNTFLFFFDYTNTVEIL